MRFLLNVLFSFVLSAAIVHGQDNQTTQSVEEKFESESDEVLRSDTTADEGGFSVDEEKLILDPDTTLSDPDDPDDSAFMEGSESSELDALNDADGEVLINDPDTSMSPDDLLESEEEDTAMLPGVTLANEEDENEEAFDTIDADGDGNVSFAELMPSGTDEDMKPKIENGFRKADMDGDGLIHRNEFQTLLEFLHDDEEHYGNPGDILKELDTDGDGKVSLAEMVPAGTDPKRINRMEKGFQHSDKNGDGVLHKHEVVGLLQYLEHHDS